MKTSSMVDRKRTMGFLCLCVGLMMALPQEKAQATALDNWKLRPELRASAKALEAGDYEKALDLARQVEGKTTEIGDPGLLEGMALNRLGRFGEALDILTRSASFTRPEFAFELGWADVGTGHYQEAVRVLSIYEAGAPGRAQTSQLLGQAYLGLGNKKKAYACFQQAEQRNKKLTPVAELYLAHLDAEENRPEQEQRRLTNVKENYPSVLTTRTLSQWDMTGEPPAKPWQVAVSVGGGYDSNVAAKGSGLPLPTGISHQDEGFFYSALDSRYDMKPAVDDRLRFGYSFQSRTYDSLGAFDYLDNYLYANYRHTFDERWETGLLASGEFTYIGDHFYNMEPAVRPSVTFNEMPWAKLDLAYGFAHDSFSTTGGPIVDRSGSTQSVLFQQRVQVPDTDLTLRGGYSHQWDDTKGTDYSDQSDVLFFGLNYLLPFNIDLDVYYNHSWDTYHNLNSVTGFAFKRRDDVDSFNLNLVRPITPWMDVFVRYNYLNDSSNINVFKYDDHIVMSGATFQF